MKRAVIFGAGQIGSMIARLISPIYFVTAFIDNAPAKWDTMHLGIPVKAPSCLTELSPDIIFLGVLDTERSEEMTTLLHQAGYRGIIQAANALLLFDPRAATMRLIAEQINELQIPGDIAELGVFRGEFASAISLAFPERIFHLFDTFTGFAANDVQLEEAHHYSRAKTGDFADTTLALVRSRLHQSERARFYPGYFPDTYQSCNAASYCFVSIDADLYAPTAAALPIFWKRLSPGGFLMIHDVNSTQFTGVKKAVSEFCAQQHLFPVPVCDLHGSVLLQRPYEQ